MVAGVIIAALGLALCFVLNGLSYVAVIFMLLRINPAELRLAPSAARARGQLREGLRYVAGNPVLRSTLLMMAIIGMLTFEFQVSLPLLARFGFQGDAGSYALLTASFGMGAVVGGLLIAGQRQVSPGRLARSALLFGLAVLVAAFMPSLWLSAAALVGVGIFSIAFTSLGNSVLQLESTPQMRGRVMAFWTIAMLGSSTLGGPVVGWVGEHVGPRWGLALGGLAALAAAGLARRLRGRPVADTFAELAPASNPAEITTTSELDAGAPAVTVGH
jgi:MFS family permease